MRLSYVSMFLGAAFLAGNSSTLALSQDKIRWYSVDAEKNVAIHLYVFHSARCSHCQVALRFLEGLEQKHAWLKITRYETYYSPDNLQHYRWMASQVGGIAGQVPAFFHCKQMQIGFVSADSTGRQLEASLVRCHDSLSRQVRGQASLQNAGIEKALFLLVDQPGSEQTDLGLNLPEPEKKVTLPLWGEVQADDLSLPLLTLVLAGCDAFNPCAFFVLLFLLSLLVHAHSRKRMLLVGGIFVLASGVVYFLFMAAWLNLFVLAGNVRAVTLGAGLVALVIAALNIKDFFWFKQGVSLTIPDSAKPGIFQRMACLVSEKRTYAMMGGTFLLAGLTNLYELLCTAGFPMVYTRILTLRDLSTSTYFLCLVAYNVIYVLPLAMIVVAFVFTLGSRKLSEEEGRILKLFSGVMMLALSLMLIFVPDLLANAAAALGLMTLALAATAVLVAVHRRMQSNSVRPHADPTP